jgi:hypothetical protein
MNPFHNLPPHQRALQRLVDQWNADETLWRAVKTGVGHFKPPLEIGAPGAHTHAHVGEIL